MSSVGGRCARCHHQVTVAVVAGGAQRGAYVVLDPRPNPAGTVALLGHGHCLPLESALECRVAWSAGADLRALHDRSCPASVDHPLSRPA